MTKEEIKAYWKALYKDNAEYINRHSKEQRLKMTREEIYRKLDAMGYEINRLLMNASQDDYMYQEVYDFAQDVFGLTREVHKSLHTPDKVD